MNTEHLVYILEAYKCGSVNKAARNCYISQSHLSTIIKNVEQEIGYPLFHRTANGITATPEGLIFMSHAEKIVTERNNIQKIPQSMSESDSLSIICARSAFVLQCFFDYKNCFPNLNRTHDKFLEAGLRENLKNVVAQNCRLGILVLFEQVIPKYMDLADQYNLEMTVLQRSIPVTALMSKSHPLANSSRVSLIRTIRWTCWDSRATQTCCTSATAARSSTRSAKAITSPSASAFRRRMPGG